MLPVGVIGAGNRLEIAHADSRFQSFVCSIVKSTLELGLTDKLKFLDGIVFHSICDPARNLGSVFKRNFPDLMVEYIHFPQNMTSPHTIDYLIAEYKRVNVSYEQLSGRKITDEALRKSIALYNEQRRLVRELYAIRRGTPQNLSTVECYVLTRIGTLLPPEEHIAILARSAPRTAPAQRKAQGPDQSRPRRLFLRAAAHRAARRAGGGGLLHPGRRFPRSVGAGLSRTSPPKAIPCVTSPTLTSTAAFIPE